jgi:NinB protein
MLELTLHNRVQAWAAIKAQLYPFLAASLQAGGQWVLTVKRKTRSIEQNSRLWAMLTEVSKQVEWYGKKLTPEDWKNVFSAALYQQEAVPGINGGFVVLGRSTSKMTVAQMSEMQTLIEAFGAERGVVFKDEQ